ncbi:hypothetical protein T484DRAFT_1789940 [Baffinella frigidus]|nr:hypothetical protein T484DRAFT_1789940 [Cryptophyta sp. CCMP2293]
MRDYLGNLQRRKTVREIVTKARKEYTEQIEQQKRRKDWSIRALKRQGERVDEMFGQLKVKLQAELQMTEAEVDEMFGQLKVKLQAELQMTEAEVSAILGEEGAYITEEDVTLSRDHAEFRLEDEEVQLQKFDKKLPRLREAAPEEQDAPEEKDSS